MKLWIDFETRSNLDVGLVGTYKYAMDASTKVIMVSWAVDDGVVHTDEAVTDELYRLIERDDVLKVAHNAEFDMAICRYVLGIETSPRAWYDTAYHAAYLGYPRKLSHLAERLHTTQKASQEEMLLFSKPLRMKKGDTTIIFADKVSNPAEWERFRRYSALDVEVMRECAKRMPALPAIELQTMQLTFEMNGNGVPFDLPFAKQIEAMANQYAERAGSTARVSYAVENLRSAVQVRGALEREGVFLQTLNAKERGGVTHELLTLRDQASGAAFAKVKKAETRICADGRIHGEFVGFGAHTGRWSSRGVQLQNFARILSPVSTDLTKVRDYSHLRQHLRLTVYAPKPYTFICADLSQIEARIVSWLAGCAWRMQAFKNGEDIYARSAERMFGLPHVDKSMPERQMGKCAELGLGYGGGANAINRIAPDFYREHGADKVADIVAKWRRANPEIARLWSIVEQAFCYAMQRVSCVATVGLTKLRFCYDGHTVIIGLPAGRNLYYRGVQRTDEGLFYLDYSRGGEPVRTKIWGGVLLENITQAIARDVLVDIMTRVQRAHPEYQLIGTVHDEVWYLTKSEDALNVLLDAMKAPITWAQGLVTKGDGFASDRYIK